MKENMDMKILSYKGKKINNTINIVYFKIFIY